MVAIRTSPSGRNVSVLADVSGVFLRRTLYNVAGAGTHVSLPDATTAFLRGGGGGGAGGGSNAAAGQASVAGGASAAGVFDVAIELSSGPSIAFNIGSKGLGNIGGAGTDGTDTTVTYAGITYTGVHGIGQPGAPSSTTFLIIPTVPGGLATNGDANYQGGPSLPGFRESATSGQAGNGGDSAEAPGGMGARSSIGANASADGDPGQFGSGGGGSVNFNNAPAAGNKGGDGGEGFLWVDEYGIVDAA